LPLAAAAPARASHADAAMPQQPRDACRDKRVAPASLPMPAQRRAFERRLRQE